jgi:hypothetical protein
MGPQVLTPEARKGALLQGTLIRILKSHRMAQAARSSVLGGTLPLLQGPWRPMGTLDLRRDKFFKPLHGLCSLVEEK